MGGMISRTSTRMRVNRPIVTQRRYFQRYCLTRALSSRNRRQGPAARACERIASSKTRTSDSGQLVGVRFDVAANPVLAKPKEAGTGLLELPDLIDRMIRRLGREP